MAFNTEDAQAYWTSIAPQFDRDNPEQVREVAVTLVQIAVGGSVNVRHRVASAARRGVPVVPIWPTSFLQVASIACPEHIQEAQDLALADLITE